MWMTWGNVGPDYKKDDMADVKQACSLFSEITKAAFMVVAVILSIVGQLENKRRHDDIAATGMHSANYHRVRGFNQTKGHWANTGGPMSGRTHERYRHGK